MQPHIQQQPILRRPHLHKFIGKPNQLTTKTLINKAYPEHWSSTHLTQGFTCSPLLKQAPSRVGKCGTEGQFRDVGRGTGRAKNARYGGQVMAGLEGGGLGTMVYERVAEKREWRWGHKSEASGHARNAGSEGNVLVFDSRFESGNLATVYLSTSQKRSAPVYSLLLQDDTNTFGYNQWFYFRVKPTKPYENARLQILNLRKPFSLFNKGMKIAIYSDTAYRQQGLGWHRGGANIQYSCNQIQTREGSKDKLYTLGWDYTFEAENQWVYFAYSYPYTYSELRSVVAETKRLAIFEREAEWVEVAKSFMKNQVYMLRVGTSEFQSQDSVAIEEEKNTNVSQSGRVKQVYQKRAKKFQQLSFTIDFKSLNLDSEFSSTRYITPQNNFVYESLKKPQKVLSLKKQLLIIMARAHPSEAPGSFLVEGLMKQLLKSQSKEIKYLRQHFWVHVIPMLNPDGVVHGNSRTSFTGNDLNRRWLKPHELLHPQIFQINQYFHDLKNKGHKVFLMIDLHAHSKKENSFVYGCCDRHNYHNHSHVKLLNSLFQMSDSNYNSAFSSHFVGASKRSTARVCFYRQFECCSYTYESSFLGSHQEVLHFSIKDYCQMGKNLLRSTAYFHIATKKDLKIAHKRSQLVLFENDRLKEAVLAHIDRNSRVEKNSKKENSLSYQSEGESEGSSSSPSSFNFDQNQLVESILGQDLTLRSQNKPTRNIGKRNLSVSISQQNKDWFDSSQRDGQTFQKMIKVADSKARAKAKSLTRRKLPTISLSKKQRQIQYHAFNFTQRKKDSATARTLVPKAKQACMI